MASQAVTAKYVPKGVNGSNDAIVRAEVPAALAAADTLSVTRPAGMDPNLIPTGAVCYGPLAGSYPIDADIALTSHNPTTGVTVLTASGAGIVAGSFVLLRYAGAVP